MALLTEQMEALARGETEGMLVVGLDGDGELCGIAANPHHRALSFVKVWELAAILDELEAGALVVVLMPAGSPRPPTRHEVETFVDLRARCQRAQVVLLDCIVVRGDQSWSLRELSR
jgi:hypothetical protein